MMFGLTKREQRWKAEQKAAEVLIPAIVQLTEAKLAMDTNERIAALEAEVARLRNQCSHGIDLHEKLQDEIDTLTANLVAAQAKNAEDAALIVQLTNACENAETEPEWLHLALTNKEAELAKVKAERDERQDMANVGEALMETIKRNLSPDWSWNDCPSEVVVDLINQRDEMKAKRDAAVADAERYRWLREHADGSFRLSFKTPTVDNNADNDEYEQTLWGRMAPEYLDQTIDAAIDAARKEGA